MQDIWTRFRLPIIGLAVVVIGFFSTLFVTPETKQAVIIRTGEPQEIVNMYNPEDPFGQTGAGFWFRIPFIDRVQMVERRVLDRNGVGVARIGLWNTCSYLANQVRADVVALGENTTADPGEQCDHRAAHTKTVNGMCSVRIAAEQPVHAAEADQAEGSNAQAHDGSAIKGDGQCHTLAVVLGGYSGAHIRLGGGEHTEVTGSGRGQCAGEEGDGGVRAKGDEQAYQQYGGKHGQHLVLALHEDHGAEVNLVADMLDLAITVIVTGHNVVYDECDHQAGSTRLSTVLTILRAGTRMPPPIHRDLHLQSVHHSSQFSLW